MTGSSQEKTQQLWLRVDESGEAPTLVGVVDDAVIGRDLRSDVVIRDEETSRMHARIVPGGGEGWVISDLDTTNGTFVNDERIVGPAGIAIGDVIRVGRATCTVVQPPAE